MLPTVLSGAKLCPASTASNDELRIAHRCVAKTRLLLPMSAVCFWIKASGGRKSLLFYRDGVRYEWSRRDREYCKLQIANCKFAIIDNFLSQEDPKGLSEKG